MSDQPDEPQDEHKHDYFYRFQPVESDDPDGEGEYLIRCECGKVMTLESIAALESQLAAATAIHHEQAKSLIVLADKNMKLAGERDAAVKEVEQLTDDKEQVIADSFAAQEQLSRALVEKKQQSDIAEMFSDWWHELMSATGAGRHLSITRAQHKAALKWIQDARCKRPAAAEAVKQKAVEIANKIASEYKASNDPIAKYSQADAAERVGALINSLDISSIPSAADTITLHLRELARRVNLHFGGSCCDLHDSENERAIIEILRLFKDDKFTELKDAARVGTAQEGTITAFVWAYGRWTEVQGVEQENGDLLVDGRFYASSMWHRTKPVEPAAPVEVSE